ncbi:MAG: hypothetical protein GTN81_04045 [Proteobacteria bacterium]|nr:hypothetical protein [Pseudomonadota bacterium]
MKRSSNRADPAKGTEPLAKLTAEMTDLISGQKICFAATCDRDGRDNVSPKGSILVLMRHSLSQIVTSERRGTVCR